MKFKSEEHFNIILRQVRKLYDHRNKTTPREVRRKEMEYKLLKSLLNKMEPLVKPNNMHEKDFLFSRQELRAIQSLCIQGRKVLNELIIPGYEERAKKEEKQEIKDTYAEYQAKAEKTDVLYAEIITDLDAVL